VLKNTVTKALLSRFDGLVTLSPASKEFAIFQAKHPAVGNVIIEEDGNELIVFIGDITHGHFGSFESGLTDEEHEQRIADDLVDFLVEFFADEYLLYKSRWTGGWGRRDMFKESDFQSRTTKWYSWSGPMNHESNR